MADHVMEFMNIIREAGKRSGRWERTKYFLSILGLLLAGQLIISAWPYYNSVSSQAELIESTERHLNETVKRSITGRLELVTGDLDSLAQLYISADANVPAQGRKKNLMERQFIHLLKNRQIYDRICIIDKTGRETIRVDFNIGRPVVIPPERHQSKALRYYFTDGMKTAADELYISPFDLNVENEKIEQPVKPTIRFIKPIFSSRGRKDGILVINYLGSDLINMAREVRSSQHLVSGEHGSILLMLNSGGYFLIGARPADEWGFMYSDKKHNRFQNRFPEVWETILKNDFGSFHSDRGMFTYTTVNLAGKIGSKKIIAAESFWKIVSYLPASGLRSKAGGARRRYLILNIFFTMLSVVVAFTITVLNSIRKDAERRLKLMASTDPLTMLLNRRAFLDRFEYERIRSSRYDEHISVIMADIDHFKRINDTLGHPAGDYILRAAADVFKRNLREQDSICRWGGEEFVVLLPITGLGGALDIAEKLRKMVETFRFEYKDVPIMLTMSFGVSVYSPGKPVEECIQRADRFMYEAKSTGRNRVSFDRSGAPPGREVEE